MRFLRYKALKSVMGPGRVGPGREYSDFSLKFRKNSLRSLRSLARNYLYLTHVLLRLLLFIYIVFRQFLSSGSWLVVILTASLLTIPILLTCSKSPRLSFNPSLRPSALPPSHPRQSHPLTDSVHHQLQRGHLQLDGLAAALLIDGIHVHGEVGPGRQVRHAEVRRRWTQVPRQLKRTGSKGKDR